MKAPIHALVAGALIWGYGSLSGCVEHHTDHVVVERHSAPDVVVAQPAAARQETVIVEPPPAERVEVAPASPGPDYVWIRGYYTHNGREYIWRSGHYEHAPRARATWIPGHWDRVHNGYVWKEGHWD